jgi:FixJ family two-component response regulator
MALGQLVLVVDDDDAVRASLKFALELEGLCVETCDSGAALLGHPGLREAHCLVLDYAMPVMDGMAVLDRLGVLDLRLPVILITGHPVRALGARVHAAGVRHVLEKPLSDGALLAAIRETLSGAAPQLARRT